MSGEKPGVRENIERFAHRLRESSGGRMSAEQAKRRAVRSALSVEHGIKGQRTNKEQ